VQDTNPNQNDSQPTSSPAVSTDSPVAVSIPFEAAPSPIEQLPVEPVIAPPKKSFPKILILIIIVSALVIVAMLLLKKITSPSKTNKQSSTTQSSPATTVKKPGAQVYKNTTSKFSLQYPAELKIKESTVGMGVTTVELREPDNLDTNYVADIQMLTVPKTLGKMIGQDFDEYYAMSNNDSKTITAGETSRVLTKVSNRTVNGQRAFDFKTTGSPPVTNEEPTIGVYIEMGSDLLIITTPEHNKEKLETILADFKYPL
jgi:hypothetical protein